LFGAPNRQAGRSSWMTPAPSLYSCRARRRAISGARDRQLWLTSVIPAGPSCPGFLLTRDGLSLCRADHGRRRGTSAHPGIRKQSRLNVKARLAPRQRPPAGGPLGPWSAHPPSPFISLPVTSVSTREHLWLRQLCWSTASRSAAPMQKSSSPHKSRLVIT
jgi:hypothetical protein